MINRFFKIYTHSHYFVRGAKNTPRCKVRTFLNLFIYAGSALSVHASEFLLNADRVNPLNSVLDRGTRRYNNNSPNIYSGNAVTAVRRPCVNLTRKLQYFKSLHTQINNVIMGTAVRVISFIIIFIVIIIDIALQFYFHCLSRNRVNTALFCSAYYSQVGRNYLRRG